MPATKNRGVFAKYFPLPDGSAPDPQVIVVGTNGGFAAILSDAAAEGGSSSGGAWYTFAQQQ